MIEDCHESTYLKARLLVYNDCNWIMWMFCMRKDQVKTKLSNENPFDFNEAY